MISSIHWSSFGAPYIFSRQRCSNLFAPSLVPYILSNVSHAAFGAPNRYEGHSSCAQSMDSSLEKRNLQALFPMVSGDMRRCRTGILWQGPLQQIALGVSLACEIICHKCSPSLLGQALPESPPHATNPSRLPPRCQGAQAAWRLTSTTVLLGD